MKKIQFLIDLGYEQHTVPALMIKNHAIYTFDGIVRLAKVIQSENKTVYYSEVADIILGELPEVENVEEFLQSIILKIIGKSMWVYLTHEDYDRTLDIDYNLTKGFD